jgi:signal transduction histidine kinase
VAGRHLADFADPSRKLGIEAVSAAARAAEFAAVLQDRPNFGYQSAHHWLRFTVDPGSRAARLFLEVGLPSLDIVEFHTPLAGGGFVTRVAGDQIAWDARPVRHRNHVFRVEVAAGVPATYYLRVASANALIVPITLWSATAFERHERDAQLLFGFFYGLIIALFLYNLMIYVSLRDRAYLWYVAYVASFGLALFTMDGFAFEHFWPHHIGWANHALGTFLSASTVFGGLFAREFLDTARREPALEPVLIGMIGMAALVTLCSASGQLIPYGAVVRVLSYAAPLGAGLMLWIGGRALLRGYAPARYFLLAWTALLMLVIVAGLRNAAVLPVNAFTAHALHIGLAFDVVMLSAALTMRIRVMQGRMIEVQRKVLETSREHEAALKLRARELADANRELEAFSHTVAHDLRAPLRAIDGFANLLGLEHRDALPEAGRRDVAMISHNARRMAQLVDGLLAFSRLGRLAPAAARVSMQALVAAVLEEAPADRRAGVTVGSLPTISGDPVLLRQVWANLVGNALKFSAAAEQPSIVIAASRSADQVLFSVTDNGVGFDQAYAGKLFGMFQRLHSAADFEGTGVGLATVKRIVERHGGHVTARAAPGRGACFEFALPAWRLLDSEAPDAAAIPTGGAPA